VWHYALFGFCKPWIGLHLQNRAVEDGSELAAAYPDWDIEHRVQAELAGARSGDVLLIMGEHDGTRYLTWHWETEKYKGWHGEPDPEVSKVPLVFAFPGGDVSFINTAINAATRVSSREDDFTNADLTPIILKVLEQTR